MNRRERIVRLLELSVSPLTGVEIADLVGGLFRSATYKDLAVLQRDGAIRARWTVRQGRRTREFYVAPVLVSRVRSTTW